MVDGSSENKTNYSTKHELAAFLFLSNIYIRSSSQGLLEQIKKPQVDSEDNECQKST